MKILLVFAIIIKLNNSSPFDSLEFLPSYTISLDNFPDELNNMEFVGFQSRITGGKEAIPHSHSYAVGLNILTNDGLRKWCGAALLSHQFAITAAHCLTDAKNAIVLIGCHQLNECLKIETKKDDFFLHENYKRQRLQNDIALIKLPRHIQFGSRIGNINLPSRLLTQTFLENRTAIAAGWGIKGDNDWGLSQFLRIVKLSILNQNKCKELFNGVPQDTNVCTDGSIGKSTCTGDSGGPLIYETDDGNRILIGITSFGHKLGCEKGFPSVFTRITSYLDWIEMISGIKVINS